MKELNIFLYFCEADAIFVELYMFIVEFDYTIPNCLQAREIFCRLEFNYSNWFLIKSVRL